MHRRGQFRRFGSVIALVGLGLALVVTGPPASADAPLGPGYPPPGGVTLGSSGNSGRAGGHTWTYSAFDPSQYRQLWWGPNGAGAAKLAFDGTVDAPGETLSFDGAASDLANGVQRWTGSAVLRHFVGGGWVNESLPTRMTLTVKDVNADPLPFIDPTTVEIAADAGAVSEVLDDFSANFIFEAFRSGAWRPVLDLYDSLQTQNGVSVRTSFGAGFWHRVLNRAPVAPDQQATTEEDTPVSVTLLASDPDDDPLTYTIVDPPQHGTLTGTAPALTYTPDVDHNGADAFTYTASDHEYTSEVATVSIDVTPVNDPPAADPQSVVTDEDTPVTITLTATDPEGDGITYEIVDAPVNGALTGNLPDLTYSPAQDVNGSDAFTFRAIDSNDEAGAVVSVGITIRPVNDAPVAGADTASVRQYETVTFDVLGNDSDVEGDTISIEAVGSPGHGSVAINADGTLTYRPDPTFKDEDTFTYTITDGNGASGTGVVTILEIGCGEDGIDSLHGTPLEGAASRIIDEAVEPVVGSIDPYTAAALHDLNCGTVVPTEDGLDDLTP